MSNFCIEHHDTNSLILRRAKYSISSKIDTDPFLRSSKTLSIYVEFPRLLIHKRNALSSLEIWVSSGKVSRKYISFVWVESPFLHVKAVVSFCSFNYEAINNGSSIYYPFVWHLKHIIKRYTNYKTSRRIHLKASMADHGRCSLRF